jgi:hypothetical protein
MRTLFFSTVLCAMAAVPACSCDNNGGRLAGHDLAGYNGDGGGPPPIGSITIDPSDVTLMLSNSGPPPMQTFTVTLHADDGDHDVSGMCAYALADPTFGVMNVNTFTAGTAHGGTTTLVASYNNQTAQATIHLQVSGSFNGPTCMTGCSFPGSGAPACGGGAGASPQIVYPPDGVLLPPNMNVITIQWLPGTGNNLFEIDLSNPATNVTILTKCTATMDTRGTSSGGCQLDLDPTMWTFVASSNKGGDPVKITVRGSDGNCIAPGANTVAMSFAEDDVAGGIYYWKSTVTTAGTGGQIWVKSFGDSVKEQQITGVNNLGSSCNGCHSLSRDGLRMTINADDDDSDDEYEDTCHGLIDVSKKMLINGNGTSVQFAPGFQTISHDHTKYLASSGDASGMPGGSGFGCGGTGTAITPNQFFFFDGNSGLQVAPMGVTAAPTGKRATMPDWSIDDKNVVFVVPTSNPMWNNTFGTPLQDDTHVLGGSLWTMPYMGNGVFGPAMEILHAPSDQINNYYPSFSPDGSFIAFNHVDVTPGEFTGSPGLPDKDSYSNPHAKVYVLGTGSGAMPIECANLDDKGDLSNSWPRWSPFVQTYKGSKLLWLTFSSTRDYGLLVRNHSMVGGQPQVQCYPPDSAEGACTATNTTICAHGTAFPANCQQPQIWMAAINLSTAEVSNPGDPSYPAFWLPFQDISTHNHTAQWTAAVANMPPPDMGTCIAAGQDCTKNPNGCCADAPFCQANGLCGIGG